MSLFAFAPSRGPRWQLGLQAALGISIPVAVMTLVGLPTLGFIAGAGAFTVLFFGASPVVDRARALPLIAAALVACAALGTIAGGDHWLSGIGTIVIAVVTAGLCFGFRLGPPGPIFFVLVFGLSAQITSTGAISPLAYVAAFAGGCAFSYLVAITPLLIPRVRSHEPRPLSQLMPGPSFDDASRMLVLRVSIVAVLGVLIGAFVDPTRSYWIVGAGVAVIGLAAERRAAFQRGLHRMLGTVLGVGVYALIALLHPQGLWIALLLGILQFSVELVVVRHYALALMIITPLVLLLTGAATGQIGAMDVALERVVDTVVGSVLGAASGLLHPRRTS